MFELDRLCSSFDCHMSYLVGVGGNLYFSDVDYDRDFEGVQREIIRAGYYYKEYFPFPYHKDGNNSQRHAPR